MQVLRAISLFAIAFLGWTALSVADEPQWPVVFVPGILGSRLCDAHQNVVWGTRSSFSNFAQLELDVPSNPALHPCGLVDEIQILGSLWTHNTYKSWMAGLADIGFSTEKGNLFIFAYDWRLSNFENAKRLDTFVVQNIGSGRKFDIVAHSMGGIVSRIYLDEYASAKSVRQIRLLRHAIPGFDEHLRNDQRRLGMAVRRDGWRPGRCRAGVDFVCRDA